MADPKPLEEPTRLSRSVLWDLQKRYFEKTGPDAWHSSEVPHYVTTNAFIAASYARVLAAFVEDALALGSDHPLGGIDRDQPINVIELGAGSGRLGFLIAVELADLSRERELPRFRVVITDFAEANVAQWQRRPEFAELLEAGQVDFALFDADAPAPLHLRHSGEVLGEEPVANPIGVVANYVVDTLRQDAFAVKEGRLLEMRVQATLPAGGRSADDPQASKDVTLLTRQVPVNLPYYDDHELDALLARYRDGLSEAEILVPVGAIRAVRYLVGLSRGRMLMLAGDKAYRRLSDLDRRALGNLVKHGSFSMMANLDALGHLFTLNHGAALYHNNRYTRFTIGAFAATGGERATLPRTHGAFRDHIDGFGPAEYHRLFKLTRAENEAPSVPHILLLLRLSRWDPTLFSRYGEKLLDKAEEASRAVQQDIAFCIDEVARRDYPVARRDDAVFLAARILYRMQRTAEAAVLFERVTRDQPQRRVGWYNLGLCLERLGRPDEARRNFSKALEVDPTYERAQRALDRVS